MQNLESFKIWSRSFIIFIVLVAIDQFSKRWALSIPNDLSLGFIHLGMSGQGPVFESLNHQNIILRVIHYATFLGPLLLLYFFFSFQFLAVDKAKQLNAYLAIWVAGIVGSILDRVFHGLSVNWITLKMGQGVSFNLATLMIIVGFIGFFIHVYINRHEYVFSNKRKFRLLQSGLQYDYVGKILFVCIFLCLTISIFSYTFMKFYISEYGINLQSTILKLYLIQIMIISGLYLLIIVMMAFHFSNRFVGPLYGFEKFIEKLENGDSNATFRVRENDHHKNLEAIADKIKLHWKP